MLAEMSYDIWSLAQVIIMYLHSAGALACHLSCLAIRVFSGTCKPTLKCTIYMENTYVHDH
jgi:hypothetical protein